ncbi:MFS transporter [Nocardioides sp.]|uniref:MFS transporter n=1 Tax=Nocardioides sp. TaxID=35761 RepID=UPI002728A356|nr:MFS transporter [Nocardioides sp.]MDO9456336.1 MFS transporter [Nocardioides sp.]
MAHHTKPIVLALMCGVVAMTVLDLSVVNVALPSIQGDLDVAPADLQWVVVTYGVAVAGFLLLGGRAGDLAGHRRVLVAGIALLAVASLVAALAQDLGVLVAGRAGQGLGAALAAPNALAIVSRTFAEGPERNRALGIFGAAGGTAAIGGSIVGGLLVQGPGWQWVFYLNVPAGLVLGLLVLRRVPVDDVGDVRRGVDLTGAATLTGGLVATTLGVHESTESGWGAAATLGLLAVGLALLGLFVVVEARVASPLVPLATLRRRSLVAANLAAALLWASFLGLIYQATLFVQQVLGYSPLAAGSSTIPIAVLSLVVSAVVAPRVIARVGAARTLALGMAVLGAGMLLLARVPDGATFLVDLLPAYSVVGLGLGFAQVAVQIAAFAGGEGDEAGLAGGAVETSREMGGAIGLALLVSIALRGADDLTEAFHRSVLGAAVLAALSAVVALALLRPTETEESPVPTPKTR